MLSKDAYEIVKEKILKGEYKPGELISLNALAKELNMSRTPVHEAIKKLEGEDLVEISPKKGAIVKEMSIKDASEINDLREAIETYAVRMSINMFDGDDIDSLRESIEKQKVAAQNMNVGEFMKYDAEFHHKLIKKFGNNTFIKMNEEFHDSILKIGLRTLRKPNRMEITVGLHEKILDCLEKKDIKEAIEALETHYNNGRANLL